MHSTNGRVKSNKEEGSNKSINNVFICKDCGEESANKKIFGERMTCNKCGSTNLELDHIKY